MIFPAPIFLYLLPLAGLPIVFHFVLKQKKRKVVFSTLMFFHRTDPKLNSHRKIRQWLLLLMRILLIAFMLIVLSRPIFQSSGGFGGKISVVAVVDNSGSMSGRAGYNDDKTKLQCAVGAARRLISTLEDSSEAAVVLLVDDPGVAGTADKESLLALLDKIRPTQATGDAGRALARAFKILRASSAGGGVVHVFSDLQEAEWGPPLPQGESAGAERIEADGAPIMVYVHKIESEIRHEANVAITAIQLPQERILPKHTYAIGLVLQNSSDIAASIRVNSIDNQGVKNTENVTLERGSARTVELETKPDEAGCHWIKVWIEGDGFSPDNEAGVGIFCEDTATVLFAGTPEEYGVLPLALSPSVEGQFTGMVVRFCSPEQLTRSASAWGRLTAAEEKPIMIVATWTGLHLIGESTVWLREYVDKGGNLLVVPSVTFGGKVVSGQLPDWPLRGWLGAGIKAREVYQQGVSLEVLDDRASFWHRIRQAASSSKLEPVSAYIFHSLEFASPATMGMNKPAFQATAGSPTTARASAETSTPTSGEFTPLLGVDFGGKPAQKTVIAHRKLGKGNVYVSGTAFAPQWNTLPLTGLLVVMAQRMAVGGSSSEDLPAVHFVQAGSGQAWQRTLLLVAGERPRGIIPRSGEAGSNGLAQTSLQEVEILSLVGDPLDWKGREQEIPAFPRAGVYLVRDSAAGPEQTRPPSGGQAPAASILRGKTGSAGNNKYCISVRASEKEGLEKFVEGSEVPPMGQIAHKILPYDEAEDFQQQHKGQARAVELYLFGLLLATMALLAEGWLGSHKPSPIVHRPPACAGASLPLQQQGSLVHRLSARLPRVSYGGQVSNWRAG